MPTKGPSYRYGNTRGSTHQGQVSKHIGYAWAKDFNKNTLADHFNRHGNDFNAQSKEEYAAKAVHFANTVDREHFKSVKDYRGSTYKYDPRNGSYAVVTKNGYVVTYHIPKEGGFTYYPKKGKPVWIKI